ncbi:MAG: fluoride efflux transporter FluC [Phycisphaeraceae bacterium]
MAYKVLLLAMGGAAGTLARVGLSSLVAGVAGGAAAVGTLAVNGLGCFLFGLAWAVADRRLELSQAGTVALLGGFLGAFTTFSTFAFETASLTRAGPAGYAWAGGNLLAQNALGLTLVFAGLAIGRLVTAAGGE